jgi:GGDEF domain-containing protein
MIATIVPNTCTRCTELEIELARAYHDPIWQIDTRQAVERRLTQLGTGYAAVVLDIDRMHAANERFGHAGVDWRIAQIFQSVRRDDTYAGRWLQGDEIVVFCNVANAPGLAIRLLVLFEMRAMGATITMAPATREGIAEGIARIDAAKRAGQRGAIV